MDVKGTCDDLSSLADELEREIEEIMNSVGQEAVAYAVAYGSYKNRTGNLRRSNKYKVERDGLLLHNDAAYASHVEQRGYDVLSGAALYAEKRLKEELE
jgi:peptidoglycan/xylan/chitin deacetylase (PgdA/CDA1 family)